MEPIDEIMTAREVAAYLKLPESAIHTLTTKGSLPALEIGGEFRFKKSVLDRWLADQSKLPQTTDLAMAAPAAEPESVTVSRYMTEPGVSVHLTSGDREGVLRELVDLVPTVPEPFRQTLFDALKAREDLCSTATGDGVAIPHARNAMVGLVRDPIIVFGRHPVGIDYGALDGEPTQLFFLLCAPNVRMHLQLLARLSRLLRQKKVRDALKLATSPAAVLEIIRAAEQS